MFSEGLDSKLKLLLLRTFCVVVSFEMVLYVRSGTFQLSIVPV